MVETHVDRNLNDIHGKNGIVRTPMVTTYLYKLERNAKSMKSI